MHGNILFPAIVFIFVMISKLVSATRQDPDDTPSTRAGNRPPRPRPARPPGESEEERYRRFMDAVGLPAGTPPPSPVQPRTPAVPAPLLPVQPPTTIGPTVAPGRLRRVDPGAPVSPLPTRPQTVLRRVPPITAPTRPAAPAPAPAPAASYFETVTPLDPPAPLPPQQPSGARPPGAQPAPAAQLSRATGAMLKRLRDPASIREAIILREVLGPPKALQGN